MVTKTVIFEAGLEQRIREIAKVNRRSFSSQVVHMIEEILKAQDSGQAQELKKFMEARV
jgi:hypothetical protein